MSSHYNNEPPPTAGVTLFTTIGALEISLFAKQAPLTCKNFLQHCLDEYYVGTTFHRVVSDFVIQGGDPTGTGSGGTSIYEDPEFEYDPQFSREGSRVELRDEIHGRLRFNRRGLLGMAKSEDGAYGSQFFVTLADADRELTGSCTMFGRLEGNSIYNALKIAEAELVEGTDRPVYAITITGSRIDDLGPFEGLKKRNRVAMAEKDPTREARMKQKQLEKRKKKVAKTSKVKLGFLDDDDEEEEGGGKSATSARPKFNTNLVDGDASVPPPPPITATAAASKKPVDSHAPRPSSRRHSNPGLPQPESQLPIPDPESRSPSSTPHPPTIHQRGRRPSIIRQPSPSASPSSSPERPVLPEGTSSSKIDRTNAEIARLKASLRRDRDGDDIGVDGAVNAEKNDKENKTGAENDPRNLEYALRRDMDPRSVLESFVPANAIRGRKRLQPTKSERLGAGPGSSASAGRDDGSFAFIQSFREKLDNAEKTRSKSDYNDQHQQERRLSKDGTATNAIDNKKEEMEVVEEEENVCDLHFIANCQSCHAWEIDQDGVTTTRNNNNNNNSMIDDDDDSAGWMTHALNFAKDGLGKDRNSKRQRQEEEDALITIDTRGERDGPGHGAKRSRRTGEEREQERKRKFRGMGTDWDQGRDQAHLRRM